MTATHVLNAHPSDTTGIPNAAQLIEACLECVISCTACADACLNEKSSSDLATCIRTDLDCADICAATARVLARRTDADTSHVDSLLQACFEACRVCATECERHDHDHCTACAQVCRHCENLCRNAVTSAA